MPVIAPMPDSDRILIVEDNRDAQEGLYMLLMREGYSVMTADNGQQALDLLELGIQPRLLILDLSMPKVSGWDLVKYLQSDPALRMTRVIVVTAMSPEDTHVIADVVLYKPLDIRLLLSTVAELMRPAAT